MVSEEVSGGETCHVALFGGGSGHDESIWLTSASVEIVLRDTTPEKLGLCGGQEGADDDGEGLHGCEDSVEYITSAVRGLEASRSRYKLVKRAHLL